MPKIVGKSTPKNLHTDLSLDSIQDQYDEFLEKQSEIKLRSHLLYSTISSYTIGTIIIIFIVITCTKHFQCIPWTRKEEPKPASRSSSYQFDDLRPINVIQHPPHALRTFSGLRDIETNENVAKHSEDKKKGVVHKYF